MYMWANYPPISNQGLSGRYDGLNKAQDPRIRHVGPAWGLVNLPTGFTTISGCTGDMLHGPRKAQVYSLYSTYKHVHVYVYICTCELTTRPFRIRGSQGVMMAWIRHKTPSGSVRASARETQRSERKYVCVCAYVCVCVCALRALCRARLPSLTSTKRKREEERERKRDREGETERERVSERVRVKERACVIVCMCVCVCVHEVEIECVCAYVCVLKHCEYCVRPDCHVVVVLIIRTKIILNVFQNIFDLLCCHLVWLRWDEIKFKKIHILFTGSFSISYCLDH
jgi:hypothetical protein